MEILKVEKGKRMAEIAKQPFLNYNEYMACMFATVNDSMDAYIENMKSVFANDQGGYKNVLYPDLEIAHDLCKEQVSKFYLKMSEVAEQYVNGNRTEEEEEEMEDDLLDDGAGAAADGCSRAGGAGRRDHRAQRSGRL